MAYIRATRGTKLLIMIGDGASPETFAHPCSINAEREFALEANVNESITIDCDDPDAPGWVDREVESLSAQITGAGTLNGPDFEDFFAWYSEAQPRNVRVFLNTSAANGGGTAEGAFLLTNLTQTGARGEKVQVSLTLQSTGPVEYTPAA